MAAVAVALSRLLTAGKDRCGALSALPPLGGGPKEQERAGDD